MASALMRLARLTIPRASRNPWTGPGAYQIGFMGFLDVNRRGFAFGINGSGGDIEFATGPDDPHGDLATIGNEDFFKHGLI